jgi:ABC-type dipeptide/oligopeptide/nickel transport system ATPase component
MELTLPKKLNHPENIIVDSTRIVVIGANGSGKTRFGTDIETRYNNQTHRISAQKSLTMPKNVSPTSKESAEKDFLYGYATGGLGHKIGQRWGSNPNTHLLNDFQKLMVLLHTEEYEESIKFKEAYIPGQGIEKPITKLDRIQAIWESVLPHRKLIKKAGTVETYPIENPQGNYNASEMSDGERVIFYLIGEVVSVPENTILVIDEPEMHIHKSINKKLWNEIEKERPDCTFVYLTHDIDFATSRQDAIKIWTKAFNGTLWDYELLDIHSDLPEQIYLDILGSRKPILFIEGDGSSIDYKILQLIFDDYTVKPLGSCQKVFETTKSFNEQNGFHHIDSFGLIDRDRRTNEEIAHINSPNIWVARVSEIENFLLIEEIVKEVALSMMKDSQQVFESVKANVIAFFDSQKEKQALEHSLARIERIFNNTTDNSVVKTIAELETGLTEFWDGFSANDIYTSILADFQELIDSGNYNEILKVFNNKGLVHNSKIVTLCDLNTKNDAFLNYVIGILKLNNEKSERIRQAVIGKIEK